MTTPNDPAAQYIVRILNINKLEQASTSFATATAKLQKNNDTLSNQLSKLTTALDKLVQHLQRGGSGGGAMPSTGAGGKTRIGGDATFGGIPHGQPHPAAGGQQGGMGPTTTGTPSGGGSQGGTKTPNGGGSKFTVVPSTGQRVLAALGGNTPRYWRTPGGTPAMYGALETAIGSARHVASMFEQEAIAQQDTNLQMGMLKSFGQQYRPAGMSADEYRQRIQHYAVGTVTGNSLAIGESAKRESAARGYALSDLDNYQYTYNMYRYASGLDNAKAQGLDSLSSAIAAVAPGIGANNALQRAHSMITPGARMRSRRLGLGDPVGKDGKFEGATKWAKRFLKRIYQGREAVDPAVFDIDFQTDATGYVDLQQALGRDDVDDFVQILRSVNKQLYHGQDVSWMDQALTDAHKPGTKYDKQRDRLAKADITFPSTDAADMQRSEAVQRGQALIANDSYLAMQDKMTTTVDTFDAAVNNFTNAPIIRDLSAWAKDVAVTLGPLLAKVMSGASVVAGPLGQVFSSQDAQGSAAASASPVTSTSPGKSGSDKGGTESGVSLANAVINEAKRWRGKIHYRMGAGRDKAGNGKLRPGGLADCSSFVNAVYAKAAGIHLGSWTGPIAAKDGIDVPLDEVVAGDILLMNPNAQNGHVGIAISRDKFIDNSSSANGVTIKPMNAVRWTQAKRVIGYEKSSKGKFAPVKQGDKYDGKSAFDSKGGSGGGSVSGSSGSSGDTTSLSSSSSSSSSGGDWGGGGGSGKAVGGGGVGLGAPGTAFGTDEISALAAVFAGGGAGASGGGGGDDTNDWGGGDFGSGDSGSSASGGTGSASTSSGASTGGATNDPDGKTSLRGMSADGAERWANGGKSSGGKASKSSGGGADFLKPKHKVNVAANKAYARFALGGFPWGRKDPKGEFSALDRIWTQESHWNEYAENKGSGAYGIPQAKPPSKMAKWGKENAYDADEWRYNPRLQIEWGLEYIDGRYHGAKKALEHKKQTGWYDQGAWQLPRDELAVVHKDEMIIPARQARTIREALVEENIKAGNGGRSADGGGGGKVVLQIASGAIVVHAKGPVTEDTGKTIIRGMLKELDRKNLYAQIARGVTDDD